MRRTLIGIPVGFVACASIGAVLWATLPYDSAKILGAVVGAIAGALVGLWIVEAR